MNQVLRSLALTDPRSFTDRLTFQRNSAPRNASGGYGESWELIIQCKGNVAPRVRPGAETLMADWAISKNLYLCLAYYDHVKAVNEKCRMLLGVVPDNLIASDTASLTRSGYRAFLIMDIPKVSRRDRFVEIFLEEIKD